MGDPWKVSRRRGMQEEDIPQPSYVEVAYDKTAAVVSTVKDLFVNGLYVRVLWAIQT